MRSWKTVPNMATVEGLQGVIAVGDTIEDCRDDLIGAIEGWVALGLRQAMSPRRLMAMP